MASKVIVACDLAATWHADQRRKDAAKTPYINHPIGVARILSDFGISDATTLCAALCHDLIEDTMCTKADIESVLGKKVADIVVEVTDDRTQTKADRKRRQVERAKTVSEEAAAVKAADKAHNLRALLKEIPAGWSVGYVKGVFIWSKRVTDNLSSRYYDDMPGLFEGLMLVYHLAQETYGIDYASDVDLEAFYAMCK